MTAKTFKAKVSRMVRMIEMSINVLHTVERAEVLTSDDVRKLISFRRGVDWTLCKIKEFLEEQR